MQPDDVNEIIPSAIEAADMISTMTSMFFKGFNAQFMDFFKAQGTALTDPFSALIETADR